MAIAANEPDVSESAAPEFAANDAFLPSLPICLADQSNVLLACKLAEHQADLRAAMAAWGGRAKDIIVARRYNDALHDGQVFDQALTAVRMRQTDSTQAASAGLDRLMQSARSALDVHAGGDDQSNSFAFEWKAIEGALLRNFESQSRMFEGGSLASSDFMAGHTVLVRGLLVQLGSRLGMQDAPRQFELPVDQLLHPRDLEPANQVAQRPVRA